MWSGEAIAEEWMKNFRMPREQFEALADELSPHISPDPSSPGMGLSVEKKLGITLYLLKDTGSITLTANAFGVSAPTVSKTIRSVCNAINTNLGPRYLKLPRVQGNHSLPSEGHRKYYSNRQCFRSQCSNCIKNN